MKPENSGCGANGLLTSARDGYCTPMNHGWSGYSTISGRMPSGDMPENTSPLRFHPLAVVDVHLVAVAVALADRVAAIACPRTRDPGASTARVGAEPHGAAEIAALARRSISLPRAHSVISPTTGSSLGPNSVRGRVRHAGQVAGALDHRHLHAEADAEERDACSRANRTAAILPSEPRSPKPPGTRMPCTSSRRATRGSGALEDLAVHPVEPDPHAVGDAAVDQRLGQRLVAVQQRGVLADHRDPHLALRVADASTRGASARGPAPHRGAGRNGAAPRGPCPPHGRRCGTA